MIDWNKIKILILDNDGVLTDGKIIYNNERLESKNFSAKDGLGIKMLTFTPIKLAVITGRTSEILEQRCDDLGIEYLYQNIKNKFKLTEKLLEELGLTWENVAYLGDDWNDYPVFKRCQLAAVPADAFEDIATKADLLLKRNGGEGAVRELIVMILKEQGIYEKVLEELIHHLENM